VVNTGGACPGLSARRVAVRRWNTSIKRNSPPAGRYLDFLAASGVCILRFENPTFAVAVQAIYDSLKHLKDGGSLEVLQDRQAPSALLQLVNRTDEFIEQQQTYCP
jgi:hypothetical protein